MLMVIIIVTIVTAWIVRRAIAEDPRLSDAQSRFVISVSEFPGLVREAISETRSQIVGDPVLLLMDRKSIDRSHWVRRFPASDDTGYLLLSGVNPEEKQSSVQLIRISDGAQIAKWSPDWVTLFSLITPKFGYPVGNPKAAQALHPLLLNGGDIIFNTTTALVRLGPCGSKPVWLLDEAMHHSIEIDSRINAIWGPSFSKDGFADNPWLRDRTFDNALAKVSVDGKVIEKRSFARILRDNDLKFFLASPFKGMIRNNADPMHVNQIQVAQKNTQYWQLGDLLISARNISTIFIYRPSTNKIIWYKTGPWMSQHSVDFVDDHRISVFDNNVVAEVENNNAFISPSDTNRVIVYDFDTNKTSQPFSELLADARPVSLFGGRARLLPDGGLFIEETQYGRHLRFTRDRLLWSRINDFDDKRIGALSWSRYLTAEEASVPLKALASHQCSATRLIQ